MCLVVKDQSDDLREWIEYHMNLGAGKFYIFDDNSTSPANQGIMDLVEAGMACTDTASRLHMGSIHHSSQYYGTYTDAC